MSYEISAWHVRELDRFRINLPGLIKTEWAEVTIDPDGQVVVYFHELEDAAIKGTHEEETLWVSALWCCGSGSRHFVNETLLPFLQEDSAGTARFLVVWECGDSVEEILIEDGEISREGLT